MAVLGILAIAGLAITGLVGQQREPGIAPDVSMVLSDGSRIDLSHPPAGKILVLNFFASWCPPCREEAPDLRAAWNHEKPKGDVVMAGVVYNDSTAAAQRYLNENGLSYPYVDDFDGKLSSAFRVTGIPKTLVIDSNGKITVAHFGSINAQQLIASIDDTRRQQP